MGASVVVGIRAALVVLGLVMVGAATAVLFGMPGALAFWPYTTYGLSRVFIASMMMAIGAPVVWIGLSGELAAVRPGGANVLAVALGYGVQALWRAGGDFGARTMGFAVANAAVAIGAIAIIWLARRTPWHDRRPTPMPVRAFFAVFALVLLLVGGALVLGQNIFPWPLDLDSRIAYGLMFLGAMTYFIYGLVRPVWGNAKGQLIGFLAYDLVLIVPYVRLWPSTVDLARLSLTFYIGVLVVSGTVAVVYLLVHPGYRLGTGVASTAPA